jgi:hypothetical protein
MVGLCGRLRKNEEQGMDMGKVDVGGSQFASRLMSHEATAGCSDMVGLMERTRLRVDSRPNTCRHDICHLRGLLSEPEETF